MIWDTATDNFTYSLKMTKVIEDILLNRRRPTKREVLRTLMAILDPVGLIANYLIYAKILLQKIWRSKIDWDEQLPDQLYEEWTKWILLLPKVENIKLPRLYSTKMSPNPAKTVQLHTFVDVSLEFYSAACYLRVTDANCSECALVGSKTKVAPNKPITIPRLEPTESS